MDDEKIITMFQNRDESAIRELSDKYGSYCSRIAWNILENREDVEECVNDTWFSVWRYIPPQVPKVLSAFCGKITKGIAIDRLRKRCAGKRPDTHMANIADETITLSRAVDFAEEVVKEGEILQAINEFLWKLDREKRDIFVRRYWYLDSMEEIAVRHGKSVGSIKTALHRTRRKLEKDLRERRLL